MNRWQKLVSFPRLGSICRLSPLLLQQKENLSLPDCVETVGHKEPPGGAVWGAAGQRTEQSDRDPDTAAHAEHDRSA